MMYYEKLDNILIQFGMENIRDLPGVNDLKAAGLLESGPAINSYPAFGELTDVHAKTEMSVNKEEERSLLPELVGDEVGLEYDPLDPEG